MHREMAAETDKETEKQNKERASLEDKRQRGSQFFSLIRFSDCGDTQTLQTRTHSYRTKIGQTENQRVLDGDLHAEMHKPGHE